MTKQFINFEVYLVNIDCDKCDSCKLCVTMCPCDVFDFSIKASVIDPKRCLGCRTCETVCKSQAITITEI